LDYIIGCLWVIPIDKELLFFSTPVALPENIAGDFQCLQKQIKERPGDFSQKEIKKKPLAKKPTFNRFQRK